MNNAKITDPPVPRGALFLGRMPIAERRFGIDAYGHMSVTGYLKVRREIEGAVQIGYMPVDGAEVYLNEPPESPDAQNPHYAYATQESAFGFGWELVIDEE